MDDYEKNIIILAICLIILTLGIGLISTKIEQETFNKFSETKVTFVEALCTDLRVIPNKN